MRGQTKRTAAAAVVFAVALGGAAIGGVVARAQVAVPSVTVTLKEFKIVTSARFRPGKVTLVVVNKGKIPHALKIAGPGVSARTPLLAPGKTARLTVTLADGTTTFWCPVGTHASLGMKFAAKFTAAGASSAGAAGSTSSSGSSSSGSSAASEWG
jgi:hypothetical protein